MTPTVSLQGVREMDATSDYTETFLKKRTGELTTIKRQEIDIIQRGGDTQDYPEWQRDLIRKRQEVLESEDYLPLPSGYEIDELAIMNRFCDSIEDGKLHSMLVYQLRGSRPFRRFRDAV